MAELKKWTARIVAACFGTALALALFLNFEIFEIEGVSMLPELMPGQHVLVKKGTADNLSVGDLVLYETPFYDFDSQNGGKSVRKVTGIKDGEVRLSCSPDAVQAQTLTLPKEEILGKVILWQKKNES